MPQLLPTRRTCTVVLLAQLVLVPVVWAQGSERLVLPRLDGPIQLDGLSDEPAWEAVQPWLPTQYEPDNGAPPTERTEFLVAYDDDYIYFALRGYDQDSTGIRSNTLYRDRLSGDDHFEILLDTFNDNETAVLFTTTPGGIRKDAAISNDASGGGIASGGWINGDFNTFWDVETVVNEEGWFAEMRVPFTSLRFQDEDGQVVMGITLQRKVARKTERLVFPPVPSIANWAFLKPSLAQKIVLEGIRARKPLYVTPYGLSGLGQSFPLNDTGTGYPRQDDLKGEAGVDLKYGLTNNLTLDLTVNTDFAQVEADDQQVNLTRFSLFFPEKRQFFQERAGIFDFRTGGLSRLFHSRRVGLTEDGQPVRVLGGARLVGRWGGWDVGFFDMQTAESDSLPSENFGVLRLRRQVFNAYSYAGAMVTSRVGTDGSYNLAYGLDGVVRLAGDDYLTLQWAQTFDHERIDDGDLDLVNSGRFTAEIERRRRRGLGYTAVVAWAGPAYDPGIGFTQRNDFTLLEDAISYTWLPGETSSLIWHTLGLAGFAFVRNGDRSIESAEVGPEWEFAAKSGAGGSLEAKVLFEDLLVPFALSDEAVVPAGSYTFFQVGASYHVSHTRLFQLRPRVEVGTFFDGWQMTAEVSPIWYVSPHLELAGSYLFNRIRFPDRDQRFDAHLARLRIGTALNTKVSTNAFIQFNSATNTVSANVRFRYNVREGNDLWIVYNEGLNTDRHRLTPTLPFTDSRTILVKCTYTFHL
ncbi:MAG: carbohydrate binding family 9 domain-containing protein [Gemmatimonadota bacterium]|nr:carbohydrate binding family 9 domain-containing protein [Gemmatimonadota bacterium]MDH3366348.1 carbohydrate binding family 9 domain-containing protein [Gemmatimonadota bacterium]MDH3477780.1 carbohydrate binding family 9 domain-containing protein [Gemmatimonadota bacterium]